jgi:hypothetical protein
LYYAAPREALPIQFVYTFRPLSHAAGRRVQLILAHALKACAESCKFALHLAAFYSETARNTRYSVQDEVKEAREKERARPRQLTEEVEDLAMPSAMSATLRDMGFAADQATAALATAGGDVERALDLLLQGRRWSSNSSRGPVRQAGGCWGTAPPYSRAAGYSAAPLPRPAVAAEDDLWRAAVRGDLEMVQHFVEQLRSSTTVAQFDIDKLGMYGRSALYQAALGGHSRIVQWLISQGAGDPDGTAYLACSDPTTRAVMAAAGLKGKQFNATPAVRLIRAERRLALAMGTMHDRLGSEVEGLFGLEYDLVTVLVWRTDACFRDIPLHRRTLTRWKKQQRTAAAAQPRLEAAPVVGGSDSSALVRQRSIEIAQDEVENHRHATLQAKVAAVLAEQECEEHSAALAETAAEIRTLRSSMMARARGRDLDQRSISLEMEHDSAAGFSELSAADQAAIRETQKRQKLVKAEAKQRARVAKQQQQQETVARQRLEQRQSAARQAPVWQGDCDRCMLECGATFGLLTWRHHCRCCGYVVCWDCLRGTARLGSWISSKTHAVKSDEAGRYKKVCCNCYALGATRLWHGKF